MAHEAREEPLGERAQQLLRTLIETYIRDGQPVGSRALSRESGLQLSSATIRNVMADLEELGFVASPHTSAGRVPTDKGYRFFVDTLLQLRPLDEAATAEIRRQFESSHANRDSATDLVATVSQLLSSATQLAGVVTLPRTRQSAVTQIEFVALSENRVLVVLVFNDREVQNRIIQLERHFSADELKRASGYLNEQFRGRSLREVRQEILRQLSEARAHLNQIMLDAISVAQQVFESGGEDKLEYVIKGETNLMGMADLTNVEKLRRLFEAFNEKRDFLHLLDHSLKAEGVQIFIGHESGYRILDDCSVVTAPYGDGDSVIGVLGVIGPTRMAYERIIPIVDITAKLLGAALNSRR
ncbi:MAG TPA: heat-inducible transcriptional repressor HrcA [Steroidobacteraceae bacterium]|jgi:heat-inducible transcriptional repressor|nr:heat-inducible transcriptional repressor HrcA [Steroidobacteraceae bacterium]